MSASLLGLALAYVFLLFVLLLALLKSEIGVPAKLVLAATCLGFYAWHYAALQGFLGWPADGGLPERFEPVSAFTVEPDLKLEQPGSIFIWARDLDDHDPTPRAYRLPYHRPTHRELDDAMSRQRRGERMVGAPLAGGAGQRSRIDFEALQRDSQSHKSASD